MLIYDYSRYAATNHHVANDQNQQIWVRLTAEISLRNVPHALKAPLQIRAREHGPQLENKSAVRETALDLRKERHQNNTGGQSRIPKRALSRCEGRQNGSGNSHPPHLAQKLPSLQAMDPLASEHLHVKTIGHHLVLMQPRPTIASLDRVHWTAK